MKVALRLPSSDAIKYPKEVGGCKKEKGERAKSRRHGKKKKTWPSKMYIDVSFRSEFKKKGRKKKHAHEKEPLKNGWNRLALELQTLLLCM